MRRLLDAIASPFRPWRAALARRWGRLSFATQMAVSGGVVLILATMACGGATMMVVTENVLERESAATAMLVNGLLSDPLQDYLSGETDSVAAIDIALERAQLYTRFPHVDVWLDNGTIAYSSSPELIGRVFPLPEAAHDAFAGEVVGGFTELGAPEHTSRHFTTDYIEIYAPIYRDASREILGVVEINELTTELDTTLFWSAVIVWLTVMATAAVVAVLLHRIVERGSNTIASQRQALSDRLRETEILSARYREATELAQLGARTFTEISDRALRQISSDIHDGPLQLLTLSALKFDVARGSLPPKADQAPFEECETLLRGGIGELRDLAQGIILPELERSSLREVIELALSRHIQQTRAGINAELSVGDHRTAYAVNICVFRFFQEGLTNAYWHGVPGRTQIVARLNGRRLDLRISNAVSEDPPVQRVKNGPRSMGVAGLRARIYALGGQFQFERLATEAHMTMQIDLDGWGFTTASSYLEARTGARF